MLCVLLWQTLSAGTADQHCLRHLHCTLQMKLQILHAYGTWIDKAGAVAGGCNGPERLQAECHALCGSRACSPQHVLCHGPCKPHHQGSQGELLAASWLLLSSYLLESLQIKDQQRHIALDMQKHLHLFALACSAWPLLEPSLEILQHDPHQR